jgi:hypothetical protein
VSGLRPFLLPVVCYLAVVLGVPAFNGAFLQPGFARHALTVCSVVLPLCGLLVSLKLLYGALLGCMARSRRCKDEGG